MNTARILIVEDDEFLRELYSDILESEGYIVDTASDGEEGLKKIRLGGYDVVLLDIVLTKISGIDIMKQLKDNPPKNPNKCTIFFTNLDDANQIKEALKFGDDYLIKSKTTPGSLVEKVKSYLNHPRHSGDQASPETPESPRRDWRCWTSYVHETERNKIGMT